jgi:hypothetical protein
MSVQLEATDEQFVPWDIGKSQIITIISLYRFLFRSECYPCTAVQASTVRQSWERPNQEVQTLERQPINFNNAGERIEREQDQIIFSTSEEHFPSAAWDR